MSIDNPKNKFKSILIRVINEWSRAFLKFVFDDGISLDIYPISNSREIYILAQRSATTRHVLKDTYATVAPSSGGRFLLVKSISWKRVFDRARRQFARGDLNQERVEEFARTDATSSVSFCTGWCFYLANDLPRTRYSFLSISRCRISAWL